MPSNRLFRRVLLTALSVAVAAPLAASGPARAQTATSLSIIINPEVPLGATLSALPTNTGQRVFVQVTNTGAVALTNQQFVVRLGAKPDLIVAVNDGGGNIGLIDPVTGAWYHTIAQIPPGAAITYSVSAFKTCPGRWPIAARVADKVSVVYASWVGQPDARCGPDESVSPAPPSFYALAWPATAAPPIVPPASSTTTTAPIGGPTTTVVTVPGAPTTLPGATTTTLGAPRPTLINLTLTATTTTTSTTTTSTTAKPRAGTPTTVLFCKTVGGKSYCAPKFSVYKPGQKKVVEIKKTTKKKRR